MRLEIFAEHRGLCTQCQVWLEFVTFDSLLQHEEVCPGEVIDFWMISAGWIDPDEAPLDPELFALLDRQPWEPAISRFPLWKKWGTRGNES